MKVLLYFCLLTAAFNLNAAAYMNNPICHLPPGEDGNGKFSCRAFIPMWSYDKLQRRCVYFVFGGCGGNKNRFLTRAECENQCSGN